MNSFTFNSSRNHCPRFANILTESAAFILKLSEIPSGFTSESHTRELVNNGFLCFPPTILIQEAGFQARYALSIKMFFPLACSSALWFVVF